MLRNSDEFLFQSREPNLPEAFSKVLKYYRNIKVK